MLLVEGLDRRFPSHGRVAFRNYTVSELVEIAERWQPKNSTVMFGFAGVEAIDALRHLAQALHDAPTPTNAGGMIESMKAVHNAFKTRRSRVFEEQGRVASDAIAREFTAEDIGVATDAIRRATLQAEVVAAEAE